MLAIKSVNQTDFSSQARVHRENNMITDHRPPVVSDTNLFNLGSHKISGLCATK